MLEGASLYVIVLYPSEPHNSKKECNIITGISDKKTYLSLWSRLLDSLECAQLLGLGGRRGTVCLSSGTGWWPWQICRGLWV